MQTSREVNGRLLAVIATILVIGALKYSRSVTMPLAFAIFLIILAWPLQKWLSRYVARRLAFALTLLTMLLVFGLFVGALIFSGNMIVQKLPEYSDEAQKMVQDAQSWAQARGLPLPSGASDLQQSAGSGLSTLRSIGGRFVSTVGLFVLVVGFLVLGLLDAQRLRDKLQRGKEKEDGDGGTLNAKLLHSAEQIIEKYQRYFIVRTVISVIQGVCTAIFSVVVGLEFAFIWGLTAALLNYIPTLGSLVSVIPPTLFALFQFQSLGMALLVFAGNCLIQVVLGTFVDPLLEGKQLQLSPLAVLFSIAFWGWVWGIPGALIGVPITVGIVIISQQFEGTQWIAELLANTDEKADKQAATG